MGQRSLKERFNFGEWRLFSAIFNTQNADSEGGKNEGSKDSQGTPQSHQTPQPPCPPNPNTHPQNDKNNQAGPPELDQMWKDFSKSLAKLFGQNDGGGNNGNTSSPRSPNKNPDDAIRTFISIVVAIAMLFWLGSGFFQVQSGEKAVVSTLGKYSYQAGAGLNWRWPAPIQAHEIVNMEQVRTVEVGYRNNTKSKQPKEALMLTEDENIVDVQFVVHYKLSDATKWIYKNRDQEETLRQIAETSIREVVGRHNMNYVLNENRQKVADEVKPLMQGIADKYELGVSMVNVIIQGVQPPEQVQSAFDDALRAEQDKKRQENEGKAYADDVIPKAQGEAARITSEAEAYRAGVVASAEGAVDRFNLVFAEYQKSPAVTRDRMYLETIQQIYTNTSKIMIDSKNSNVIHLPLDKINSERSAQVTVPTLNSSSTTTAHVNGAPTNSGANTNNANTNNSVTTVEVKGVKDGRSRDVREREGR